MSKQIAKENGLEIGEKVIYPQYHPYIIHLRIVTIRDVTIHNHSIIVLVEELEGYLDRTEIYTKEQILKMF